MAVNSLLKQTYRDFELIILDNQSTDDTAKICTDYARNDTRIRYIVDTEKRFAEASISQLGNYARGIYCMVVNDDDLWEKRYIEKTVQYLDTHPQADLVYGSAIFITPENRMEINPKSLW